MKIGLCGFGVVGRGVYEIIRERDDMQVRKVLCLEDISLPDAQAVKDFGQILNDPEIDTVVEAMGGLHPSYEFVSAALKAGKNVVTSNKALVCTFYDELIPLAAQMGVKARIRSFYGNHTLFFKNMVSLRRQAFLHHEPDTAPAVPTLRIGIQHGPGSHNLCKRCL